jgi:4-hydroxy-tetrahydrodipicolinate synthase
MIANEPTVFCMSATPFTVADQIDEPGLRAHLRRMVAAGVGVYLGSGGAGEGHALSLGELRRVCEIGVEECAGRVPTYANPPEARTAAHMLAMVREAAVAGVEVVQIYPVDGGHAMKPTYAEQECYYRHILDRIDHPVALSVHIYSGFIPPISLLQSLCQTYPQIVAINVMGTPIHYLVELRDAVPSIAIYVRIVNLIEGLAVGCRGCLAAEPNIVPRLCRSIVDHYQAGDIGAAGAALANVVRFASIVDKWSPSTARWVKMAMKVLDLPGSGDGRLREPYLLPAQSELDAMAAAFQGLDVRGLEGL